MGKTSENAAEPNKDSADLEESKSPEAAASANEDAAATEDGPAIEENTPKDEVATLKEQVGFYIEQLQLSRAELENFRRRTAQDRDRERRRITADVFRQILPVYDDLQTAAGADAAADMQRMLEGLRLISEKFAKVLAEVQITPIPSVGEPFDPEVHEAMFQEETDRMPDGHVLEEFERGYLLAGELLRAARVKVAKSPPGSSEGSE